MDNCGRTTTSSQSMLVGQLWPDAAKCTQSARLCPETYRPRETPNMIYPLGPAAGMQNRPAESHSAGVCTLSHLVQAAVGLGARQVAGWSDAEQALTSSLPADAPYIDVLPADTLHLNVLPADTLHLDVLRARIEACEDPLGNAF